ncbi:probable G-protein coupled receptor Mth-like 3 [Achroia grisella]|uniref:probable G-protein coupled receptor Mth-like 3 n=1 Tax=Achroia grisella TaxID=688607 RepID=UPI0027D2BBF8|nr:probable G-protein coupled receptor Mth-like 3 [Achroia grisella]
MIKEKMFIIIVVINVVVINVVGGLDTACCDTGQLLRKFKSPDGQTNKVLCFERESNRTMPLSIACEMPVIVRSKHYVSEKGHLVLQNMANYDVTVNSGEYCLHRKGNSTDENSIVIVLCVKSDDTEDDFNDSIKGYCMIISVIFLTLTASVYAAIPELRDLLGKSLISFCASLSIGLFILVVMKLVDYSDMALCAARGFLAYFFILSSFFWSNAMAIQIMLSMSRPTVHDNKWRAFLWYSLYAWGCPALLTVIMAIINFHPGDHAKPGLGLMHCWFVGNQQWYYMYSVMSILILANIIIFIWTSTRFWCLSFNSSHIKAGRYKLMLTIRLFVLMGIPWIFEMISSFMETSLVWTVIDIINTLQGLFIFILLVVLRRRVLKMMLKHGWLDCISDRIEKHLALAEDEEDVVEHAIDVRMTEKGNSKI